MSQQDRDRYIAAAHAMQSGVAVQMNYDSSETDPKHLRVGINVRAVDQAGLVTLLTEKGVFTLEEYEKAVADAMEREAQDYGDRMRERFGPGDARAALSEPFEDDVPQTGEQHDQASSGK